MPPTHSPTGFARRKNAISAILILAGLWLLWRWTCPPPPIIDPSYGRLPEVTSASRFAVATFLSENPSTDPNDPEGTDYYYAATRVLTYQLLRAERTRLRSPAIDFLVLVTDEVAQQKVDQLTADGATVVRAPAVPLSWWIATGVARWKDQFTKLRLLQMTQYARVLFVDADTMLTGPIDGVFAERATVLYAAHAKLDLVAQIPADEAPVPARYVFCARSDNAFAGERAHAFPPPRTERFSAGFWVAAPSVELFELLMRVMGRWRRFDPHTMEQSLLNYVFRTTGAMPWCELDPKWSATWPSERDLDAGVVTLHEKFGMEGPPERLRMMWFGLLQEMRDYYERER